MNCHIRSAFTILTAAIALLPCAAPAQAQADARPPGGVQLMNQVETLNADLNRLRGQLEVLNNGLENAQRRQRDMYLDLDTRMRRLEQGAGDGAAKADGKPASPELEARVKKLNKDYMCFMITLTNNWEEVILFAIAIKGSIRVYQ